MLGITLFEQFNNATFPFPTVNFQLLSMRLVTNATDLRYRYSKKLNLFGGFRYADRLIQSVEERI